jgi:hypothetical protein
MEYYFLHGTGLNMVKQCMYFQESGSYTWMDMQESLKWIHELGIHNNIPA